MNKHDIDNLEESWKDFKMNFRAGLFDKGLKVGMGIVVVGTITTSIYLFYK